MNNFGACMEYDEYSEDDGLKSGGNSICSSCFCNTDLCNGPCKAKVGGRYLGICLFVILSFFIPFFCHFYLQVGGDIWKTKRVWINLSFDIDLQPEREHFCDLSLILYPEQIENALIGIE